MQPCGPTSAGERRWTFARHLTVWVGFLCIFAQLCSSLHLLLVEHVRCAEHGEWVHDDGGHEEGHVRAARSTAHDAPAFTVSAPGEEHGHDDCLACSERPKLAVMSAQSSEPWAQGTDVGVALLAGGTSPGVMSVYAFAPKTSPPV